MSASQTAAILSALSLANGKRRERTADAGNVERVVNIVAKGADRTGLRRTCGTVANAYSYRAWATVIAAVHIGDVVRVLIMPGNAAKVAHGGHGFTESAKNQDVTALLAEIAPAGTVEIPVASARRPLAKVAA